MVGRAFLIQSKIEGGSIMERKIASVLVCAFVIMGGWPSIIQNSEYSGSDPTQWVTNNFKESPWPIYHPEPNHIGFCPYDIKSNNDQTKQSNLIGEPAELLPTIDSEITTNTKPIEGKINVISSSAQNHSPISVKSLDITAYEGDNVQLECKIRYTCVVQIPYDVIIITSYYYTGSGSRSFLIKNGGIFTSRGGSHNLFVESGGIVQNTGGSCKVYLKNGASFNCGGGGGQKIYYEPKAKIINPGNSPTLIPCDKIKFEGYDPDWANIVLYEWDFESDGIYDYNETPGNAPDGIFDGKTTHIYGDSWTYTVTVRLTDDKDNSDTGTYTATIYNKAPIITPFGPFTVSEGSSFLISASAMDPGSDDLTFNWKLELGPKLWNPYYNDGIGCDPPASPWGTFPFFTNDTISHTYYDNGNYSITLIVRDDHGIMATYETWVTVLNLAPIIRVVIIPSSGVEGDNLSFTAIATDFGSDDLTFTLEIDGVLISTNIYYNDGIGTDPYPSPDGKSPFTRGETENSIFTDDGSFSISFTVIDDDGGITTYKTYIMVNNLPPSITYGNYTVLMVNSPRTIGYWGHQCEVEVPYGDHTGILQEWIDNISSQSQVFSWISTEEDVESVVQDGDASDMIFMAKRQLMGVWLNVVSGKLHPATEVYMPNLTASANLWDVILEIEDVILNSENRTELERVKDIADNINNGIGVAWGIVEFTATATDPGADDLTFHWDFGDGKTQENFYPNPGGVFPISATDNVDHSYFSQGTFTVTLTVSDDDGGTSVITQIITF